MKNFEEMIEEIDYEVYDSEELDSGEFEARVSYIGENTPQIDGLMEIKADMNGSYEVEVDGNEFACKSLYGLRMFLIQFSK